MTPIRRREAWIITGIAALYLLIWILLPKPSFWGIDSGLKYQGMKSFAETGSIEMPIPGLAYGLPPEYRAYSSVFTVYREQSQIPVFSTVFLLLGGILLKLLGSWGPFLLPLLGGFGVLYASWLLWIKHRGTHDGSAFLLLVGLGTPVFFYSLELWEHTIAAALVTLAFVYIPFRRDDNRRRDSHRGMLLSGILLALATLFRTEAGAVIAIILIFWQLTNRSSSSAVRFIIGVAIVGVPGLLINYWMTHEIYPLHVLSNILNRPPSNIGELIEGRARNFYALLLNGFDSNAISIIGLIPLLSLPFWRSWRNEQGWWPYVFVALLGAGGFYLWESYTAPNRIGYTAVSGGLFWVTPFLALALLPLKGERRKFWQLSWAVLALFILTVVAFFPSVRGVHWGARMVLLVMPLGLLIAVTRAQRWWEHYESARPILGLLLVLSIVNQGYSIGVLGSQRLQNKALNQWVAPANTGPVLTNLWWMPGDCALASYRQPWFVTKYAEYAVNSINGFRRAGVKNFSFIEFAPYLADDVWPKFGARKVGEEYFRRGQREIRRTILEVNEFGATPPEAVGQGRIPLK